MAHSIQTCRNKTEVINDLDLLIIIGFALEIGRQIPRFEELQELMMQWRESLQHYGPGVIDLRLEQLDKAPAMAGKLGELLVAIVNHISKYGETIPAHVLNEQSSVPGVKFSEYSAKNVEESVKRLQSLIS